MPQRNSHALLQMNCANQGPWAKGMESFRLKRHIACFQGSLQGLVAAMSGNVDCVQRLQMSVFLQFKTYCKMSFFLCLLLSEIWFFRHQNGWIIVKIFQFFYAAKEKKSPETLINVVSINSCLDTRIAISQKDHIRIWWHIVHFDALNILILLQLILCMGTFMRL